jgi:hypothetical protein
MNRRYQAENERASVVRRGLVLAAIFALLAIFFGVVQARVQAQSYGTGGSAGQPAGEAIPPAVAKAQTTPAPVAKDTCLHCHINGEDKGLWTPLMRWSIFGGVGLAFLFGMYRSASVWTSRAPWKPLRLRAAEWLDERYQVSEPLSKILNKPVPTSALRWWYCLGGITAFLFVVQAGTGIMLAFYYKPTPQEAFASIQFIENQVRFGAAIRAVHHWAANGMIVMCVAHMLRVFIMGAFKNPRELNWVSGALLLILTLAFGFTGYLLPWDQRAFWATTVGSEIAGSLPVIGDLALVFLRVGWNVTALTLSRFYALHVIALPIFTLAFMGAHFLMVRRLGIAQAL